MEKSFCWWGCNYLKNMKRLNFDVSSEGPSSELLVVVFVVVNFFCIFVLIYSVM